ncbi:Ff.00g018130.m01.CDS01 [Fusarium sp. VM40]|nr:Ff.00g018130.m01.CDS01 [Fusarium sp. VM40]
MAPSVFHQFSRLPAELRFQIWEAACVGPLASHRSLQYVNVQDKRVAAIPCGWPKAPEQIITTKVNRSAYLIDGGLWRACKESREVIAKYTQFEDWVRIQKGAIFDFKYHEKYNAEQSDGNESPHPAFINTCEGEEECRMLVYPTNDIFCIQADDWIDLKKHRFPPYIHMSLNLYKRNDRENDDDNRYGWPILQRLYLQNIALEFDNSWLVDLPDCKYGLAHENSARGFLAKLIFDAAYDHRHLRSEGVGIWIVDKKAKWLNNVDDDEDHGCVDEDEDEDHDNADKHHDTVYRDCDGEYIEVHEDNFVDRHLCYGAGTSAVTFLRELGYNTGISDCDWHYESDDCDPSPEPTKQVRMLVRRDNKVKEITRGCKPKCHRVGRCICSDDEGEWREDKDEDKDVKLSKNEA